MLRHLAALALLASILAPPSPHSLDDEIETIAKPLRDPKKGASAEAEEALTKLSELEVEGEADNAKRTEAIALGLQHPDIGVRSRAALLLRPPRHPEACVQALSDYLLSLDGSEVRESLEKHARETRKLPPLTPQQRRDPTVQAQLGNLKMAKAMLLTRGALEQLVVRSALASVKELTPDDRLVAAVAHLLAEAMADAEVFIEVDEPKRAQDELEQALSHEEHLLQLGSRAAFEAVVGSLETFERLQEDAPEEGELAEAITHWGQETHRLLYAAAKDRELARPPSWTKRIHRAWERCLRRNRKNLEERLNAEDG